MLFFLHFYRAEYPFEIKCMLTNLWEKCSLGALRLIWHCQIRSDGGSQRCERVKLSQGPLASSHSRSAGESKLSLHQRCKCHGGVSASRRATQSTDKHLDTSASYLKPWVVKKGNSECCCLSVSKPDVRQSIQMFFFHKMKMDGTFYCHPLTQVITYYILYIILHFFL